LDGLASRRGERKNGGDTTFSSRARGKERREGLVRVVEGNAALEIAMAS